MLEAKRLNHGVAVYEGDVLQVYMRRLPPEPWLPLPSWEQLEASALREARQSARGPR